MTTVEQTPVRLSPELVLATPPEAQMFVNAQERFTAAFDAAPAVNTYEDSVKEPDEPYETTRETQILSGNGWTAIREEYIRPSFKPQENIRLPKERLRIKDKETGIEFAVINYVDVTTNGTADGKFSEEDKYMYIINERGQEKPTLFDPTSDQPEDMAAQKKAFSILEKLPPITPNKKSNT